MFSEINLNNHDLLKYSVDDSKSIKNLSKVNIFIGPNNSGKSMFLRSLFSNGELQFKLTSIDLNLIDLEIEILKNEIDQFLKKYGLIQIQGLDYSNLVPIKYFSYTDLESVKKVFHCIKNLRELTVGSFSQNGFNEEVSSAKISNIINFSADKCFNRIKHFEKFELNQERRKNIYIPTLRGLRGISEPDNKKSRVSDNYKTRTLIDYFENEQNNLGSIYTGLTLYDDARNMLLGTSVQRSLMKEFETFISKNFFESKNFTIIPSINDDVVHIKIGEDEDYPIYKLGEGIQSIIILTYQLFFRKGEQINFFFEEPDLFLHPGFQRIFFETINREEFNTFQYFFTTHSNHFLDMTLDFTGTSVYAFSKTHDFKFNISNVSYNNRNILELLGIRNSSVFLSNCTIWVEGITDRIYIRKYLEIYSKNKGGKIFQEDIHYSFVEYGGNNITHFSFLDSEDVDYPNINVDFLCSKLFLITDKDNEKQLKTTLISKKSKRQEALKLKLKERYYCLNCREIENLLTTKILQKVIIAMAKNDDSLNFNTFNSKDYRKELLGTFIDSNIKGLSKKFAGQSGTISEKLLFAKLAVQNIENTNDLSAEAINLTKSIYNFIEKNN